MYHVRSLLVSGKPDIWMLISYTWVDTHIYRLYIVWLLYIKSHKRLHSVWPFLCQARWITIGGLLYPLMDGLPLYRVLKAPSALYLTQLRINGPSPPPPPAFHPPLYHYLEKLHAASSFSTNLWTIITSGCPSQPATSLNVCKCVCVCVCVYRGLLGVCVCVCEYQACTRYSNSYVMPKNIYWKNFGYIYPAEKVPNLMYVKIPN